MIGKIFKPKAPKVPEDAALHFHFASDSLNPDGTYKQPVAKPELEPAIARVAEEIRSLRRVVDSGKGLRTVARLTSAISEARTQREICSKELEVKRRQFAGGVVEMGAVQAANDRYNQQYEVLSKLQDELSRKQTTDAAQIELDRILSAVS
ncbi:hypothetical protein [Burkholderia pseudomallei]|uniref:hypothetical protein n=1 Tax=Burkholderia pseudomallei TaxID=28450 RepID=UPI00053913DF|nr:hypothetical protein [Burkholderia pseudomallei]KGX76504.1 hypothetical protein Y033_2043 [Burkholderia pseudomallei MSHR435]